MIWMNKLMFQRETLVAMVLFSSPSQEVISIFLMWTESIETILKEARDVALVHEIDLNELELKKINVLLCLYYYT